MYSGLPRRSLAKTEVPALPYLENQASQRACSSSAFLACGVHGELSGAPGWLYFAVVLGIQGNSSAGLSVFTQGLREELLYLLGPLQINAFTLCRLHCTGYRGSVGHKAQWLKVNLRFFQLCVNNCWIFIQSNSFF